jgi:hypothetical protein
VLLALGSLPAAHACEDDARGENGPPPPPRSLRSALIPENRDPAPAPQPRLSRAERDALHRDLRSAIREANSGEANHGGEAVRNEEGHAGQGQE